MLVVEPNVTLTIENSAEWITEQIKQIPHYPAGFEGRGIVMCAGGLKYLTNAYASIRLLRSKGCNLPIQCWYLGEKEYDATFMSIISRYNVEFIDAMKYMKENPQYEQYLGGWELKPFSALHCPWKEILILDADVFCDGDPTFTFDSEIFKTNGAIFCPDYRNMNANRNYWKAMGITYRDEPEFESGIVFLDKEKCWNALNLATKICEYGTRFFFHAHGGDSFGDKDCFRAAWHRTNTKFYMIPQRIWSIPGTMVQHDITGKRMFYHRNMRKLHLLLNESVGNFANEKEIFKYLEEVKKEYNPYILQQSEEDKQATQDLEGSEWMYIRVNRDERKLTFLKNNMVGQGRAKMENTYCVHEGKLYLIDANGSITMKMEKWTEGWIGRWLNHEKCCCILVR